MATNADKLAEMAARDAAMLHHVMQDGGPGSGPHPGGGSREDSELNRAFAEKEAALRKLHDTRDPAGRKLAKERYDRAIHEYNNAVRSKQAGKARS